MYKAKKDKQASRLRDLPELRGPDAGARLLNLYHDLGWDQEKDGMIDPSKIKLNEKQLEEIMEAEIDLEEAREQEQTDTEKALGKIATAAIYMQYGPGSDPKVPWGKVLLEEGWNEK